MARCMAAPARLPPGTSRMVAWTSTSTVGKASAKAMPPSALSAPSVFSSAVAAGMPVLVPRRSVAAGKKRRVHHHRRGKRDAAPVCAFKKCPRPGCEMHAHRPGPAACKAPRAFPSRAAHRAAG